MERGWGGALGPRGERAAGFAAPPLLAPPLSSFAPRARSTFVACGARVRESAGRGVDSAVERQFARDGGGR